MRTKRLITINVIICSCLILIGFECQPIYNQKKCPFDFFENAVFDYKFNDIHEEEIAINTIAECYLQLEIPITNGQVWKRYNSYEDSSKFYLGTLNEFYQSTRLKALYWVTAIYFKDVPQIFAELENTKTKIPVFDLRNQGAYFDSTKNILETVIIEDWQLNEAEVNQMNEILTYFELWLTKMNGLGLESLRQQQISPIDETKYQWIEFVN